MHRYGNLLSSLERGYTFDGANCLQSACLISPAEIARYTLHTMASVIVYFLMRPKIIQEPEISQRAPGLRDQDRLHFCSP